MSNYPPGVTGNEPQIIGTGMEDKCFRCMEKADEEMTLAGIPDGVVEVSDGWLCQDCVKEAIGFARAIHDMPEYSNEGSPQ